MSNSASTSTKPPKENTKRYAYEPFRDALTLWGKEHPDASYTRALRKLRFMILGYAHVDFNLWPDRDDKDKRELALSYAWEDAILAFTGHGQSAITGTIIDLWSGVADELHATFKNTLNAAKVQCEVQTSFSVARRYLVKYRSMAVRSPGQGFDLPSIVPCFGTRHREWAVANDMDPDESEHQMRLIEEYTRLGLLMLENDRQEGIENIELPEPPRRPLEKEMEHTPPANQTGRRKSKADHLSIIDGGIKT